MGEGYCFAIIIISVYACLVATTIVIANNHNNMHVVLMRHTQAGGYVTPFFVVGGICIIFAVPLFLLSSKVPCK